jgi:hypothetical protein
MIQPSTTQHNQGEQVMYEVINTRTRQVVGTYKTLKAASRKCDKMDFDYGAKCSFYRLVTSA